MSKKPMNPAPESLYPPDVKTPEEKFNFLGRRLFSINPDELMKKEAQEDETPEPQKPES